jgi:hypothetical protein
MSARRHHTVVAGQRQLVRVFPVSGLSVCWLQADGGARYAVGYVFSSSLYDLRNMSTCALPGCRLLVNSRMRD